MRVEIYGDANRKTVSGPTVQFTADDAAPVTDLKAQINPSIAGHSSVTITANGQNTSVSLTKPVYGGAVDVTTGVVTETHGGGAYNPTAVPSDLSSKIVSATTARSASGSVASFNCSLGEYPMSALTAAINPVQDLHGYDHPWPGGGGKNKLYNGGASTYTTNGITFVKNADGSVTANGTSTADAQYGVAVDESLNGDFYFVGVYDQTDVLTANAYLWDDTAKARCKQWDGTTPSLTSFDGALLQVHLVSGHEKTMTLRIMAGKTVSNFTFYPMICVSTETDSAFEPYENACPITGRTGATIHVSPTTSGGTTYSVTFPTAAGTVYGGTHDVVGGELAVEWICYAFTGNESVSEIGTYDAFSVRVPSRPIGSAYTAEPDIICDRLPPVSRSQIMSTATKFGVSLNASGSYYVILKVPGITSSAEMTSYLTDRANAGTPVTVCYRLGTPVEYASTPQDIATILGQNNVWADTGDVTVSYRDGLLSNVSGIMTNSTALTTGENITYTLSQERTFQIPGTVIRTVVGNNVMSASTGNISVTWSSHWFDITPWIAYQGLTFSRNDVDAPNAGRDMSGYMHRGRVGVKEKMNITTVQLTRAQSSTLQTLLYPETIQVRVTPYPRTNTSHTMSMYTNNVKTTYVIHRENGEDLQSLTFPLIEN